MIGFFLFYRLTENVQEQTVLRKKHVFTNVQAFFVILWFINFYLVFKEMIFLKTCMYNTRIQNREHEEDYIVKKCFFIKFQSFKIGSFLIFRSICRPLRG